MSLQRYIQIKKNRNNNTKNKFPIPETPPPEAWYYTRLYDFWLSGYCRVRLRNAAIFDLSKMADIEGAQVGFLEKLVADGHI